MERIALFTDYGYRAQIHFTKNYPNPVSKGF